MFLFFKGFQPRNFLVLFLFTLKHSFLLILLGYFTATLEENEVPKRPKWNIGLYHQR